MCIPSSAGVGSGGVSMRRLRSKPPRVTDMGSHPGCSCPWTFGARTQASQGLLYKHLTDPLWKCIYGAATPKWLEMVLSVIKLTILIFFVEDPYSQRVSKLHYWFKSYSDFDQLVDFAYWWSCIGKGLRLQSVQYACFLYSDIAIYLVDLFVRFKRVTCGMALPSPDPSSCLNMFVQIGPWTKSSDTNFQNKSIEMEGEVCQYNKFGYCRYKKKIAKEFTSLVSATISRSERMSKIVTKGTRKVAKG